MEENKDYCAQTDSSNRNKWLHTFIHDFFAGICVGVAFMIPGFSGGSMAAMLGIYEKMISAVAKVFVQMKKSIITLLPIGLGLLVGVIALMYPLGYLVGRFPLPTVSVFVGFAIGGIPSMWKRIDGKPTVNNIVALSIPLVVTTLICFIPNGADVDLFNIDFGGYVMLFLIGILGSCALVMPGISGSMLLLVFGYYRPIINMVTEYFFKFQDMKYCTIVLCTCGVGLGVGFFSISVIMKLMLDQYPRGTYFAIMGFIIGSLPTVYVSTLKDAGMISDRFVNISMPTSFAYYVICILLVAIGAGTAYAFSIIADKKTE